MRTKKARLNASIGILTYILGFLPNFIVRRVFLNSLGSELLGLSSLYTNIISYLSIVEMGIGSAIIFSLYKPFSEGNKVKIKGYLNYYSKFYKLAGVVILLLGIIIMPFLDIFIKGNINIIDARKYFLLFLINTFISYMFSYKLCILNVAQEGYKVSIATAISKIVISILQSIFLIIYPNFYYYIFIQISINIIYFISLNLYIDIKFKWLKSTNGKIEENEKKSLAQNVKALFLHKIGSIVVFGTDNLLISAFINLVTVTRYNSYNMIISAIQGIITTAMNAITPSVGNLLVEEDRIRAYKIHKQLFFVNFWVVSFICISLYNTITQFIIIWLGNDQVINNFTIAIIIINLYFLLMRSSVEVFKNASGNYSQDKYSSIIESIINLVFSIVFVNLIGLPGIFLGTLISNLSIIFWIKPQITYKYVFNIPLIRYFKMYFKYIFIAIIPLIITNILTSRIKDSSNIFCFLLNCFINIIIINGFYLFVFRKDENFKYCINLILRKQNNVSRFKI